LVCAARQGHGQAAYKLGCYLEIMENYYMAAEYMYRGAALGHDMAGFSLGRVFSPSIPPEAVKGTMGFRGTTELSEFFFHLSEYLEKNPNTRTPDLFKTHPLPENVVMTREQSRALPSLLKDDFDGQWPDEIFPELAPDYMPPEE
jgi:TPR repeat protein